MGGGRKIISLTEVEEEDKKKTNSMFTETKKEIRGEIPENKSDKEQAGHCCLSSCSKPSYIMKIIHSMKAV